MKYLIGVVLICSISLAAPFYNIFYNQTDSYSEEELDRRTIIRGYKVGEMYDFNPGDLLIFNGEPASYAFVRDLPGDGYCRLRISTDSILFDAYDLFEIEKIFRDESLAHILSERKVSSVPTTAFDNDELFMVYREIIISESSMFHVVFLTGGILFFFLCFFVFSLMSTLSSTTRKVVSLILVLIIVWLPHPYVFGVYGFYADDIYGSVNVRRVYSGLSAFILFLFYYLINKFLVKSKNDYIREACKFLSICFFSVISLYLSMSIIGLFYPELKRLLVFKRGRIIDEAIWMYYYSLYAFALAKLLVFIIKRYRSMKAEKEVAVSTQLNTTAQLNSLQARLNPHFLYNTLNSIASLIKSDPEKAEEMTLNVSKFMRHFSNRHSEHLTQVSEEVEMIKEYLEIEKIRFAERLEYVFEVSDEARSQSIPRSLLQPLVENAVKYGYSESSRSISIRLVINYDDPNLVISIYDGGKGFDEALDKGYGLSSVYDKLMLLYDDAYDVSFTNHPDKHISISIQTDKLRADD